MVYMRCFICNKLNCFTAHHISYDPEISLPVCNDCHFKIHHGDEYIYLDPTRIGRSYIESGENRIRNIVTGEIIEIPTHLWRYANYAIRSRAYNRAQMRQIEDAEYGGG